MRTGCPSSRSTAAWTTPASTLAARRAGAPAQTAGELRCDANALRAEEICCLVNHTMPLRRPWISELQILLPRFFAEAEGRTCCLVRHIDVFSKWLRQFEVA